MRITGDHPLAASRMISVLLDGVNIDDLRVVWADMDEGKVGVMRRSVDAFPAYNKDGPVIIELTGEVRLVWSPYAADLKQDIRDRLAELYPEITGLCNPP